MWLQEKSNAAAGNDSPLRKHDSTNKFDSLYNENKDLNQCRILLCTLTYY